MLIKSNALKFHLKQSLLPVYIICGSDDYFLHETKIMITQAWRQQASKYTDVDALEKKSFEVGRGNQDWELLAIQLQSFNLFSEKTLYLVTCHKNSLDKSAQRILFDFVQSNNEHANVIITGNKLKQKSLTIFENHKQFGLIPVWSLKPNEFLGWIDQQLKQAFPKITIGSARLISRFCHNNPYAVRQVIAKLKLTQPSSSPVKEDDVTQQLSNQCEFQIFDLSDACLEGNTSKVLQILTHLRNSPKELTLLLWAISKEVRILIQLYTLCQSIPFMKACQHQGIWRSKTIIYQSALRRTDINNLSRLAALFHHVDVSIKTGNTIAARHTIERMAISLATGKEMFVYE